MKAVKFEVDANTVKNEKENFRNEMEGLTKD
jgi:hypothetical protein